MRVFLDTLTLDFLEKEAGNRTNLLCIFRVYLIANDPATYRPVRLNKHHYRLTSAWQAIGT